MFILEWFNIEAEGTDGLVLEFPKEQRKTQLIINYKNGSDDQLWTFDSLDRLTTKTNLTADIAAWSHKDGAEVIIWDAHDGKNQKWTLKGKHIESHMHGKVLRRQGNHEGSLVEMWSKDESVEQKWRLLPGTYYIIISLF